MAELDARETLFLELINRARLDPLAEAARYSLGDLNSGLPAGTITSAPKQILVANALLADAAVGHSAWMLNSDVFSHTGSGGSSASTRMQNAGYVFSGSWTAAENISWSGSSSQSGFDATNAVSVQTKGLFLSAGHRLNILNGDLREIGVGGELGFFNSGGNNYYALMTTFAFAASGNAKFIGGVSYNDTDGNRFYSVGEGIGGRTVQLLNGSTVLSSTTAQSAGAFSLPTTASGSVEIVYSGADLASARGAAFVLGTGNVKFDLVNGNTIKTNVSAKLTQSAENLTLLGIESVDATGNELANILVGNAASNVLTGGGGSDSLDGRAGSDTAVFSGTSLSYVIGYNSSSGVYSLMDTGGVIDYTRGIETFQFSDATLTAQQLVINGDAPDLPPGFTDSPAPEANYNIIKGTSKGETLTGTSGRDSISGGAGSDVLDGAADADILIGGIGNDRYVLDDTGDMVMEKLTEGTDKVFSSVSVSGLAIDDAGAAMIGKNVERFVLTGSADVNVFANKLDNRILGNNGTNSLSGGKGDDRINGLDGADVLSGGAGHDRFDFTSVLSATNIDMLSDFNVSSDAIGLKKFIFATIGKNLDIGEFFKGSAAHDANDRIIHDSSTGDLIYDADGWGVEVGLVFARVNLGLNLTNLDFVMI